MTIEDCLCASLIALELIAPDSEGTPSHEGLRFETKAIQFSRRFPDESEHDPRAESDKSELNQKITEVNTSYTLLNSCLQRGNK